MTSNKRLDFGDDLDRDAERGIFKGIFVIVMSNSINNNYSAYGDELPWRRFAF